MSQADIDAFILSAGYGTLTSKGVVAAVGVRGIPVNGQSKSNNGFTALHGAVICWCPELIVALVAAGANANVKHKYGKTSVWWGAAYRTADILQLLIDGGGSVNEADNDGRTSLIALVTNFGDTAARLKALLACPDLDLNAKYKRMTAEEWAANWNQAELATAIAEERARRKRWSALRFAWIAATVARRF
jgi:ankyrin repeat protein